MDLEIDVIIKEKKSVVHLAGEIDIYTSEKLKGTLMTLAQQENHTIEVYLDDVNYMDSVGLGIFIGALKSTRKNNSVLKLVNLQDRVYRLFKITGIHEVLDINFTVGRKNRNGEL